MRRTEDDPYPQFAELRLPDMIGHLKCKSYNWLKIGQFYLTSVLKHARITTIAKPRLSRLYRMQNALNTGKYGQH